MLAKILRSSPRLLEQSSKLNFLPALYQSTDAKVIESKFKFSGNVPHNDEYHQIPYKVGNSEPTYDPEIFTKCYPTVPTLEDISIEKQDQIAKEETDPDVIPKTLEDKMRVWFGENMPTKYDEKQPERDLVNFPRIPPILDDTPKTRLYFLPESWFKAFEHKTGVTGGYMFGFTFGTFLLSKELLVFNDVAYNGVIYVSMISYAIMKYGRNVTDYLTSYYKKERQGWADWQHGMKNLLDDHIKELKQIEERSMNPKLLFDAKRENLLLQQEAEYRRRLTQVYNEVKRKLDYQVAVEEGQKGFTRRHLINWVIDSVNKNLNAELEKAVLKQCVVDLKTLSVKRKNVL